MTQAQQSGEADWVETFFPLIIAGMIGFVVYIQRGAILGWLATEHILIAPTAEPPITLFEGYGIDVARIALLLIPAAVAAVSAVAIGLTIWRNCTAPRRPR